jgi:hypothetical protein
VTLDQVISLCWSEWRLSPTNSPPITWLTDAHPQRQADVQQLWLAAPADAMTEAVYKALPSWTRDAADERVWRWLSPALWDSWLKHWSKDHTATKNTLPFQIMPESVALQAVLDDLLPPFAFELRQHLWTRLPGSFLLLIEEATKDSRSLSSMIQRLIEQAPIDHMERLVDLAEQWITTSEQDPEMRAWTIRWLMYVIDKRPPTWRQAYRLLINTVIADGTHSAHAAPRSKKQLPE